MEAKVEKAKTMPLSSYRIDPNYIVVYNSREVLASFTVLIIL